MALCFVSKPLQGFVFDLPLGLLRLRPAKNPDPYSSSYLLLNVPDPG